MLHNIVRRLAPEKGQETLVPGGPEIIILVLGPTGSGKSTLIKSITGQNDIKIGHGLKSRTKTMDVTDWTYGGKRIRLVDSPGFDDTYLTSTRVLELMGNFLQEQYERKVCVNGILFLHRIIDVRMTGSSLQSLKIMRNICGDTSLKNVILVETFWDAVWDKDLAEVRERELIEDRDFWAPMIEHGSRVFRYDHKKAKKSTKSLIGMVLENQKTVLELQRELVDQKLTLLQTVVGKGLGGIKKELVGLEDKVDDVETFVENAMKSTREEESSRSEVPLLIPLKEEKREGKEDFDSGASPQEVASQKNVARPEMKVINE